MLKPPQIPKKRKRDFGDDDQDDLPILPPNLPVPLRNLCLWAKDALRNGATIHTILSEQVFGSSRKVYVFRRDIYALANMKELSASCIVMYMR
jgi:hypothetical protein